MRLRIAALLCDSPFFFTSGSNILSCCAPPNRCHVKPRLGTWYVICQTPYAQFYLWTCIQTLAAMYAISDTISLLKWVSEAESDLHYNNMLSILHVWALPLSRLVPNNMLSIFAPLLGRLCIATGLPRPSATNRRTSHTGIRPAGPYLCLPLCWYVCWIAAVTTAPIVAYE